MFCCAASSCETNELYIAAASLAVARDFGSNCTGAVEAAAAAGTGALLLSGADGTAPSLTDHMISLLASRRFRIFAEQPHLPPRLDFIGRLDSRPCTSFARLVMRGGSPLWSNRSCHVNRTLAPLDIVEPNLCRFTPFVSRAPPTRQSMVHASLAKVAGYTTAVFGVSSPSAGAATFPWDALVSPAGHPGLMLSALELSAVVSSRHSPVANARRLWVAILRWLTFADACAAAAVDRLAWVPAVRATYGRGDALPSGATRDAVARAARWLHSTSGLLVTPGNEKLTRVLMGRTIADRWPVESLSEGWEQAGDGSRGMYEAYLSAIEADGAQMVGLRIRTDCIAESTAALAIGGAWLGDARSSLVCANLLGYLFNTSLAQAGPRDPSLGASSPLAGLLLWGTGATVAPMGENLYSDDQYRSLLCAALASSLLGTPRWHRSLAALLLGNARLVFPAGLHDVARLAGGAAARQRLAPLLGVGRAARAAHGGE